MAAPTPSITTQWDGTRGFSRYYVAWTAGAPDNLADSVVVDVSALSPIPPGNSIKVKRIDALLSGNFQATLEFDSVRSGVVNTASASTQITWVSGDKFDTAWVGENFGGITVNGTEYAITSVDSTTAITAASDPGDQTAKAYSQDGTVDRFIGQADELNFIERDYSDGPNGGITPYKASDNLIGDIILTTAGVAANDELNLLVIFERT